MDSSQPQPTHDGDGSDNKRVFQCGECNRAYSRVDHLTRHVRSHTREKPYRCDICSKGFSRGDLLKRHTAAHQRRFEESKQNGTPAHEKISRVSRACKACSEMHLRCDDSKPCERCVKKNIKCITADSDPEQSTITDSPSTPESSQYQMASASHVPAPVPTIVQAVYGDKPYEHQTYHLSSSMPHYAPQTTLPIVSGQGPYPVGSSQYLTAMHAPLPVFENQMTGQNLHCFPFTGLGTTTWNDQPMFCFGGFEPAYLMNETDMAFLDTYNYDIPFEALMPTPEGPVANQPLSDKLKHTTTLAHDAHRKNAVWRWDRHSKDTGPFRHQELQLPPETSRRRIAPLGGRTLDEKLDSRTRDRLVKLVVDCCESDSSKYLPPWHKWSSTFPGVELLDALIQFCLHAPLAGASLLFHLPTMSIRDARPELVMSLVAMGAVMTPDAALRKLGIALQEVVRQSLLRCLEVHNELTRDLQMLQAYHIHLVVAFWSGDSRRTELAEASMNTLVTMLRRANRYRKYKYPFPAVSHSDHGAALEKRWHDWIEAEQWKRVLHHGVIGDAMNSLILLSPPLISFAEVVLPLPDSQELWSVTDAVGWQRLYLSNMPTGIERLPSLHDCMIDITNVTQYGHLLNDRFMIMGIISNIWRKVWEYRQNCTLFKDQRQRTQGLEAQEHEVQQLIANIRFGEDLTKPHNVTNLLFLEIVTVHVHMSLDDIQLFTGLEGVDEARRIYPELVAWSQTPSSRKAMWHAGQVLRIAKNGPKSTLNAIGAVAVYQSALAFWTYGLMLQDAAHSTRHRPSQYHSHYIWLDELEPDDKSLKSRFIEHNDGLPIIRGLNDVHDQKSPPVAALDQPALVMDVIMHVFRENWNKPGVAVPILVENLLKLMMGLRTAAEKFVGP